MPHYTATTTSKTPTPSHRRKKTLLTLLALATLSTLSILYLHPPSSTYLPYTITSRTRPKTFIPNPSYNDLSSSADGNWTALLPPNGGFFSTQVGDDGDYEMVGLTMFHQLHCLGMIRGALQNQKREIDMLAGRERVVAGTDRRRSEDGGEDLSGAKRKRGAQDEDLFGVRRKRNAADAEEDLFGVRRRRGENEDDLFGVRRKRSKKEDDLFGVRRKRNAHIEEEQPGTTSSRSRKESHSGLPKHYLHCFDYLVQTILCNADATPEPAHETEDGGRAVDGYDVQHQCQNADAVWAKVMGANSVPGWKLNAQSEDARERETESDTMKWR